MSLTTAVGADAALATARGFVAPPADAPESTLVSTDIRNSDAGPAEGLAAEEADAGLTDTDTELPQLKASDTVVDQPLQEMTPVVPDGAAKVEAAKEHDHTLFQGHVVFVERQVGGTEMTVALTLTAKATYELGEKFPATNLAGPLTRVWAAEVAHAKKPAASRGAAIGWDHNVAELDVRIGKSSMPLVDQVRKEVEKDREVSLSPAPIVRPDLLARMVSEGFYPVVATSDTAWALPSMGKRNEAMGAPYQLLIGVKPDRVIIFSLRANGDAIESWASGREIRPYQVEAAIGEATRVVTGCRASEEPKAFKSSLMHKGRALAHDVLAGLSRWFS